MWKTTIRPNLAKYTLYDAAAKSDKTKNWPADQVVAKWTDELDMDRLHRELDNETSAEADAPEAVLDAAGAARPAATPAR